ncbi:MAG: hypothetical protein KDD64_13110 [Bdellovibrionales bacterium]|nr:hypothetical protein [Bdellovibrionales bacterium]MCB0354467.1 hypothetical protein [Bdellovibrionales bacterium]
MANRFKIILVSLLLFAGAGLFVSLSSEDEFSEVRRTFRELLSEASIEDDTPPLERLFKAKKVATYFDEGVIGELVSDAEGNGGTGTQQVSRKSIERYLIAAYRVSREIFPEIVAENYRKVDSGVELDSILRVYGDKPGEDVMYLEELRLHLLFAAQGGDWLITRAQVERVSRG